MIRLQVAVSPDTTTTQISTDDGITWQIGYQGPSLVGSNHLRRQYTWQSLCYGNGIFILVGPNGSAISKDGVSWTTSSLQKFDPASPMAHNERLCIVLSSGNCFVSVDGISWTQTHTFAEYNDTFSIAADAEGDIVVIGANVTKNGKFFSASSTDGYNWIENISAINATKISNVEAAINFNSIHEYIVAYNHKQNGLNYLAIASSNDRVNWHHTVNYQPVDGYPISLAIHPLSGHFIILNSNSTATYFHGLYDNAPQQALLPLAHRWNAIEFGGTTFTVTAYDSTTVLSSLDGISWTVCTSFPTASYSRMVRGSYLSTISGISSNLLVSNMITSQSSGHIVLSGIVCSGRVNNVTPTIPAVLSSNLCNSAVNTTTIALSQTLIGSLSTEQIGLFFYPPIFSHYPGELWSWGGNASGQLGLGSTSTAIYPSLADHTPKWHHLANGQNHSMCITNTGELWAWGDNTVGQLGINNTINQNAPVRVGVLSNWVSVACGNNHTIAIDSASHMWAWGGNVFGELGQNNTTLYSSPVQVGGTWTQIACGDNHSLAVTNQMKLFSWGKNDTGQLGLLNNISRSTPVQVGNKSYWSIVASKSHSAAITLAAELFTWGSNNFGQLGNGNTVDRSSPVQVGPSILWTAVSCGDHFTAAIGNSNKIYSWGDNSSGQLGLGNTSPKSLPTQLPGITNWLTVQCGSSHTVAISMSGELFGCGDNSGYQLGLGDTTNRSALTQIGSGTTWLSISGGLSHTVAIQTSTI